MQAKECSDSTLDHTFTGFMGYLCSSPIVESTCIDVLITMLSLRRVCAFHVFIL